MADPTAQRVWDTALGQLQIHVTRPNYDTWLKDTQGLRVGEGQFVVGVPTEFVKEWLATRMRGLVSQTIGGILGQPTEVAFEIIGRNGSANGRAAAAVVSEDLPLANGSAAQAIISSPVLRQHLNPRYNFRSFVVADSNRMAAAAAAAAADRPGEDYNPLFIYSSPGLGKTHLLQAIALRAAHASRNALYVTSEQFTNDFVTAIAQGRADEFRRRYRSVQLLMVDDIQFLAGKGRTQEEFFYTFNDLHSNGCQLVVASDRPPAGIPGLEGRLCSRFQWGLIADIQPPDEETRLAILQAKSREQKVDVPADVAHFLSDRARDNVRQLEGLLNRVVAYARLTSSAISLAVAARALAALTPTVSAPSDPQTIMQAACSYYNVTLQALVGKSRAKPIAEARHMAMYLLREDAELALKQVGLLLGHRDHSTIIHGVQKVARGLISDPRLSAQLADIRTQISI
ncbi:MAG: chromosomal replication initiator protein DnaA [Dehalococcoidia bacterium]|nr:chromosomal replication initiator protein DnaA [Dehalococcoidia bacterium]